jgi:hypothetical protein
MSSASSLSEIVEPSEDIGRMIFGGFETKSQKRYFVVDENNAEKYLIKPSVFLDTRNPMELSVNRISTISLTHCHQIGIDHHIRYKMHTSSAYSGFAKIKAEKCYEQKCTISKDETEYNPYHANIHYPAVEKEDCLEIAAKLTYYAELILN